MFSIAGIDLLEQELLDHERTLLEILLQDKTTKKSIIWATDDYAELGEQYSFKKEILPELVTGEQDSLIQPRVEKALEHQTNRTRDKAEVFTPSWICNAQNNLVDEGTSALDQKNADIVEKSLLSNPDLTLILISHHLSDERKAQFDHVYELTPASSIV